MNRTFSIAFLSDQLLTSLVSGETDKLNQIITGLDIVQIPLAENMINQAASGFVGQAGVPVSK